MATQTAIGFSSESDPLTAFRDAAVMAKNQTPLSQVDLAIVFATPTYTPVTDNKESPGMDLLRKILQPKLLIGITAPALILTDGTKDKGVSVLLIESDEIAFTTLIQEAINVLPLQETGINFARDLTANLHSNERHGAIVFCSTIALNHSLLIRGLRERLGSAAAE